jgi:hypothetical protein
VSQAQPRFAPELYDLQADPHELNNLCAAARYASTVVRMRQELARLQTATAFVFPAPANGS